MVNNCGLQISHYYLYDCDNLPTTGCTSKSTAGSLTGASTGAVVGYIILAVVIIVLVSAIVGIVYIKFQKPLVYAGLKAKFGGSAVGGRV